ncbi:MAG TPA: MarR family transcriptional regulator [Candidatus Limnocylindrales bacterium]|nr:MarR family transcriptional regulator [Candidatus Limnocylindrales bacterium]
MIPAEGPDPAASPPDDQVEHIIADFRTAITTLKVLSNERVLKLGLSMAQLNILYTLKRCGEMPMSRLAEMLNVSLSNATGLIDRIEERGLVERTRVPEDRRIVLIRVTAAGEQLLRELDVLSDDLLRSVLGRLTPSELTAVGTAFTSIRDALTEVAGGLPDRHGVSIPSPRSSSTVRGGERPTQPNQ